MADLLLSDGDQRDLRSLLAAEPVPGDPFPGTAVLETIARLIPCDAIGVGMATNTGHVVDEVSLPKSGPGHDPQVCDGPLWLGLVHVGRFAGATDLPSKGTADALLLGIRNGADHVCQLYLDRTRRRFSDRDVALLRMLTPVLQRLMRERPTPQLPASLTVQERRVLMEVAAGRSNAEIAECLAVAPSTVRKHLEHSFRKLGVGSRLAAVASLQGRDRPDLDLKERIERYG